MSPLDRLLAETIPIRPAPAPEQPHLEHHHGPWTPQQQEAHWKALCNAVGTPDAQRPTRPPADRQTAA